MKERAEVENALTSPPPNNCDKGELWRHSVHYRGCCLLLLAVGRYQTLIYVTMSVKQFRDVILLKEISYTYSQHDL